MAKKIFKKEYLVNELDLPWTAVFDEIVDTSRWSVQHNCVFKDNDGKFYETFYSIGATECQDERPWEYEDDVTCYEVEQREVKITKWVRVDSES